MASVIGKWKIESSENFEEYMKAIGEYKYFFCNEELRFTCYHNAVLKRSSVSNY